MASALLWIILLLRFCLTFPKPKRTGESRLATRAIYGVWVLFLALLIIELIVHPRLYHTAGNVGALLILGYIVLILAALTHTLVKTPRRELRESGMSLIFAGLLVTIVGVLVPVLVRAFGFSVPGLQYLALLFAAIPFTMALAVRKHARLGRAPAS
jgi:hypothetical protein